MPHNDSPLFAYARARLMLAYPPQHRGEIDVLLQSPQFKALRARFDLELDRLGRRHFNTQVQRFNHSGSAHVRPLTLPQLHAAGLPPSQAVVAAVSPQVPAPAPAAAPAPAPAPAPVQSIAPTTAPGPPPAPPAPALEDAVLRLPNARAGERYQQALEVVSRADAIIYIGADIPAGLALSFDPANGTFSGTPDQAAEPDIRVRYHYARQPVDRLRQASLKLIVNANPKSMWQDLPSDQTDIYWRPDQQSATVSGAELRVIAASKRGRSHAHVGSFRDDDYAIDHLPATGWYLSIAADGAGSARYSRKGAAIICEQARNTLASILSGERSAAIDQAAAAYYSARSVPKQDPKIVEAAWQVLRNALYGAVGNAAYYATKGIVDETSQHKLTQADTIFKDYSSTALISICKKYPFGTLCAAYWVGDGAVGIYSKKNGITLLGDVDSGEFSGQTRFLESAEVTQDALIRRTRFEIVDDMTALVVMTDGVSDPKFETEARLARDDDWHAFWRELEQATDLHGAAGEQDKKLLDWLDFWSQGNHDDRTIAIIY